MVLAAVPPLPGVSAIDWKAYEAEVPSLVETPYPEYGTSTYSLPVLPPGRKTQLAWCSASMIW